MTTLTDLLTTTIPPHSLEAERAILGILLLERDAAGALAGRLEATDFYKEGHRTIFATVLALAERGEPTDLITVPEALRQAGRLEAVGGPAALAGLVDEAATLANLSAYVGIVRDRASLRLLIRQATETIAQAYAQGQPGPGGPTAAELVRVATEGLAEIAERVDHGGAEAAGRRSDEPIGAVAHRVLVDLAMAAPQFIRTPIASLNRILGGGWLPGELIYVGAGPGTGKSAIALEWMDYFATKHRRVLGISAEMTKETLVRRALAQRAEVPVGSFRSGEFQPGDLERVERAVPDLARLPIILDDQATTLGAIRRLVHTHQPDVLVVDYLQLLQPPRAMGEQRRLEVDALSRALKRLAKRHQCTVIVLSQINLVPDGKGWWQRPFASSLKESRGLHADADTVLILWQPKREQSRTLELIVGKGRDHATGSVELNFQPLYLHFREL